MLLCVARSGSPHNQWRSEGRAWPGTCPAKAPCSSPSCPRDLARALVLLDSLELAYSRCPANTNDLATPLPTMFYSNTSFRQTQVIRGVVCKSIIYQDHTIPGDSDSLMLFIIPMQGSLYIDGLSTTSFSLICSCGSEHCLRLYKVQMCAFKYFMKTERPRIATVLCPARCR